MVLSRDHLVVIHVVEYPPSSPESLDHRPRPQRASYSRLRPRNPSPPPVALVRGGGGGGRFGVAVMC